MEPLVPPPKIAISSIACNFSKKTVDLPDRLTTLVQQEKFVYPALILLLLLLLRANPRLSSIALSRITLFPGRVKPLVPSFRGPSVSLPSWGPILEGLLSLVLINSPALPSTVLILLISPPALGLSITDTPQYPPPSLLTSSGSLHFPFQSPSTLASSSSSPSLSSLSWWRFVSISAPCILDLGGGDL